MGSVCVVHSSHTVLHVPGRVCSFFVWFESTLGTCPACRWCYSITVWSHHWQHSVPREMKEDDGAKVLLKTCQAIWANFSYCNFFVAVIAKLCRRWGFVCNKSPTYFGGGITPTLQNGGQKSWSYIKTAPTKPFSGLALAHLDAVFLLECFWFGLFFLPPPSLVLFFANEKKVLRSLEWQQTANTPVLEN